MDSAGLLSALNARHGTAYRLVGPLAGGAWDATFLLEDAAARPPRSAVLKRGPRPSGADQFRRLVPLVERARAGGYPLPQVLLTGVDPAGRPYLVREFAPGAPLEGLSPATLDLLLAVNDRQRNVAVPPEDPQDWSRYARAVVYAGESGWAAAMRAYSPATAALLAGLEAAARPYATAPLPTTDLVHGDFHTGNVLALDGRVTAVIDFEFAGRGTRAYDLANLLLATYYDDHRDLTVRQRLWARTLAVAGPAAGTVCLVCQLLGKVEWSIRRDDPAQLAGYLRSGWQILDDLAPAA